MFEVVPMTEADHAIERAVAVLEAGGAVVLPTDTVYGVAALPSVRGATSALFDLKDRSDRQPLAVLVANEQQALTLIDQESLSPTVRGWMERLWPGALTLVASRSAAASELDLGGSPATIGLRCPDHDLVRAVAGRVGPIATTSANRHGEPTPTSAVEAAESLTGPVDLVIDGGTMGTVASTVVDVTADPWRILRRGALTEENLS